MRALVCAVILLASAGLIGCADQTVSPPQPSRELTADNPSLEKGVEHSATGSGSLTFWDEEGGRVFYRDQSSFSAIDRDGRVTGQMQYTDREMQYTAHGRVTQLIVDGNMAKIAWVATRGPTYPEFEGRIYGFVVVVDNGEGGGTTDQISWGTLANEQGSQGTSLADLIAMDPQEYLDWLVDVGLTPPLWTYLRGNIQVR